MKKLFMGGAVLALILFLLNRTDSPDSNITASEPGSARELRGELARRREYDLWLIQSVADMMEPGANKAYVYCKATISEATRSLTVPEFEHELRADGVVVEIEMPTPPDSRTPEQRWRDGEDSPGARTIRVWETEFALIQDCSYSMARFGTWHNKPMPSDQKLRDSSDKAMRDQQQIDSTLDPRLVDDIPAPFGKGISPRAIREANQR